MRIFYYNIFNFYNKMTNNIYMLSTSISFVYFMIRFIEIRIGKKDPVPFKQMLKDTFIVFISCILGGFVLDQMTPFMNESPNSSRGGGGKSPAFTDNPNF